MLLIYSTEVSVFLNSSWAHLYISTILACVWIYHHHKNQSLVFAAVHEQPLLLPHIMKLGHPKHWFGCSESISQLLWHLHLSMACARMTRVIIIMYFRLAILELPYKFLEVLQYHCAITMHLLSFGSECGWGSIFVPLKQKCTVNFFAEPRFQFQCHCMPSYPMHIKERTLASSVSCCPYYKSATPALFQSKICG
jgi:hypothetical protein